MTSRTGYWVVLRVGILRQAQDSGIDREAQRVSEGAWACAVAGA